MRFAIDTIGHLSTSRGAHVQSHDSVYIDSGNVPMGVGLEDPIALSDVLLCSRDPLELLLGHLHGGIPIRV